MRKNQPNKKTLFDEYTDFFFPQEMTFNIKHKWLKSGTQENKRFKKRTKIIIGSLVALFVLIILIVGIIVGINSYNELNELTQQQQEQLLIDPTTIQYSGCFELLTKQVMYNQSYGWHFGDWMTTLVGGIVEAIITALLTLIWDIIYIPLTYATNALETIFLWMSGANIFNFFLEDSSTTTIILITFGSGIFVLVVSGAIFFANTALNKNSLKGIEDVRKIPKNMFLCIMMLILFVPIFLIIINLLNFCMTSILDLLPQGDQKLSVFIYNASFDNGMHNHDFIPIDLHIMPDHFIPLIAIAGQVLGMMIMGYLVIYSFAIIIELLIFYVSAFLTLGSVFRGDNLQFYNQVDNVKEKSIVLIMIFFSYIIFKISLNIFVTMSLYWQGTITQTIMILVGLLVGYLLIKQLPSQIAKLFSDSKTNINDATGMMSKGFSSAKNTAKTGIKLII